MIRQIAVVSGKGGTGKTTATAAFADLAGPAVLADCDVEAPNLHLVTAHALRMETEFFGRHVAALDVGACRGCGACTRACRYGALRRRGSAFAVDPLACEGCGACRFACPYDAISLAPLRTGRVLVSSAQRGAFAHAELDVGADGSGRLVTEVRRHALEEAQRSGLDLVLIDGAPGTGCAVIATIGGTQGVVAVTEPSRSGLADLGRLLDVAAHFHVPAAVVVNRWDIEPALAAEIERESLGRGVPVAGRIPFDEAVPRAIAQGLPVTRLGGPAAEALAEVWAGVRDLLLPDLARAAGASEPA